MSGDRNGDSSGIIGVSPDLIRSRWVTTNQGERLFVATRFALMIRLLGSGLRSSYVQLNVQISDMGLVIQTNTTITDPSLVQLDLENLVLDAVARVCDGVFEWVIVNQRLELTL